MLESLFNKVAGLMVWNFIIKKRLQGRCFPVNTAKILRTVFFYKTPQKAAFHAYKYVPGHDNSLRKTILINRQNFKQ